MKLLISASLALSILVSGAAAQSMPWRYHSGADRLTDEPNYYAITSITDYDVLIVGCSSNTIWVTVKLGALDIRFGDYREVAWRVDQETAVYQKWENLERGGAMLFDNEAIEMAQAIRDATSRIVVKSGTQTAEFGAEGSTNAINQVMESCNNPSIE
jgi:hypothetical protein